MRISPQPQQKFAVNASVRRDAFEAVRLATLSLVKPLSEEDCTVQSMPEASPVKWHLAHTSWFFETFVLTPHVAGYELFNPAFKVLFNSYYHAVGVRHPRAERWLITRSGLRVVLAYRALVVVKRIAARCGSFDRAGLPPRTAAPRADFDGREAHAISKPTETRVPKALAVDDDSSVCVKLG